MAVVYELKEISDDDATMLAGLCLMALVTTYLLSIRHEIATWSVNIRPILTFDGVLKS